MVHSLATFYGSSWPDRLPLWVAFHPAPPGGFGAAVAGNAVFSQPPSGFSDNSILTSILLHELSHRLCAEISAARAWWVRRTMLGESSPTRELAYRWLDEALATAAASGWAYHRLTDSLNAGRW